MEGPSAPARTIWKPLGGGLLAALVFMAVWMPWHPAEPLLETADLYTHLTTSRHLVRGEGFRTDVVYPLSFAFPFARELPQPLIHRGPGFAMVLTVPYLTAGRDPDVTVGHARSLQLVILGLIVATGAFYFLRRGQGVNLGPWLVFLAANPLLVYAVDWVFEELLVAWLLLVTWMRVRGRPAPGPADGLLAGLLGLFRLELIWLPILWWLWFAMERRVLARRNESPGAPVLRPVLIALVVLVLVQSPWLVRNTRLTGQPFFTLQSQAELVKDTSTWPGYSIYKTLEPQPVTKVLSEDPVPVLRKAARGLKFYVQHLPRLLPWPYLVLSALLVIMLVRGKITRTPCPFRPERTEPMSILPEDTVLGPVAAAAFSLALLCGLYSLFDHSLRHLLVLVPVLALEFAPLTGHLAVDLVSRKLPSWPARPRTVALLGASIFITGLILWATEVELEGWRQALHMARSNQEDLTERVDTWEKAGPGKVFVTTSAEPWFADRPGIWRPEDEAVRERIRDHLVED